MLISCIPDGNFHARKCPLIPEDIKRLLCMKSGCFLSFDISVCRHFPPNVSTSNIADRSGAEQFLIENVVTLAQNIYNNAYSSLNALVKGRVCKKKNP